MISGLGHNILMSDTRPHVPMTKTKPKPITIAPVMRFCAACGHRNFAISTHPYCNRCGEPASSKPQE